VYSAARILRHFDLGGHTLEINGALIRNMDPYYSWGTPVEIHNGTIHLPGESAYFHIDDPNWQGNLRAALTGPARFVKFGRARLALFNFGDRDFAAQEGELALSCETPEVVSGVLVGSGRIIKEGAGTLTLTDPEPVNVNNLSVYGGTLAIDGGAAKALNLDIGAAGNLALLNGASLTGLESFNWAGRPEPSVITLSPGSLLEATTFYIGIRNGNGWNFFNHNTCVVQSENPGIHGGTLDMKGGIVVPGTSAWGWPSWQNNTVVFDNVTLVNAQLGMRYSGTKIACNVVFTNNAAGHVSALYVADEGGSDAHWQVNTGSKLHVAGNLGMARIRDSRNVLEINGAGSEVVHSGRLWINECANEARSDMHGNGILVANGGRYTHAGPANTADIAMNWDGSRMTNNFIRVTGPGSVFDGGGFIGLEIAGGHASQTDFGSNRWTTHNGFTVENGALADNLAFISLAAAWFHYMNPQCNPCSNLVAIATGAIVNCGPVTVGNGAAFDNILRLAGGTLNAASLTMHSHNTLDVQLQTNGLPESRVSGAAVFGANTRLVLSAVKGAPTGRFDVLTAEEGIEGFENLVVEVLPERERSLWRHGLDNGGKTLYVRRVAAGTILMVR